MAKSDIDLRGLFSSDVDLWRLLNLGATPARMTVKVSVSVAAGQGEPEATEAVAEFSGTMDELSSRLPAVGSALEDFVRRLSAALESKS